MESDETNFPCSNSRPGSYGLFSQNTTSPELRAQLEFHCIAAGVYGNGTLTSWRGGNGWPNNRYATWERGLFNSTLICSCSRNCTCEHCSVKRLLSEFSIVSRLIKSEIDIVSRLLSRNDGASLDYYNYRKTLWLFDKVFQILRNTLG